MKINSILCAFALIPVVLSDWENFCSDNKQSADCCPGHYYTFLSAQNQLCTRCPVGFSCVGKFVETPVPCPSGTFANATGMSACMPTTVCSAKQYESQSTNASRDRVCSNYTTCADGNWKSGWSNTTDGTCTACTTCQIGFSVVKLCGQFQNRVCVNTVCNTSTDCGSMFCNYGASPISGCDLKWELNTTLSNNFLCTRSLTTGNCTNCPVGWTASGGYCAPCPTGSSCDVFGVPNPDCGGTCTRGLATQCNLITGRVDCSVSNPVNLTAAALGNYNVYRAGVIDHPDLGDAYFQCNIGYYASSTALGASGTSSPLCLPCKTVFTDASTYRAVSAGLSYSDPYSCLFSTSPAYQAANSIGMWGVSALAQCPPGTTSDYRMAPSITNCVACAEIISHAAVDRLSSTCSPVCDKGFTLLGHLCVDHTAVDCTQPGYFLSQQDSNGQVCDVSPLPWNGVGNQSTGGEWVSVSNLDTLFVSYDPVSKVSTNGTQIFTGSSQVALCKKRFDYPTYVQDVPLTALSCDQIEYHRFYLVHNGSKMLCAFLERSFGFNHRFLLWGITYAAEDKGANGNIVLKWRLPGKVCSVATSVMGGVEYLYMHFCNTSYISFIPIQDHQGEKVIQALKYYTLGFNASILIGGQASGKTDGLRDIALFGNTLSLAVTSDQKRLFVADHDYCRIVEVWIDYPGSFLTHAITVRASCYDPVNAIPFPRLLTPVLGGAFLLFMTDIGLFQMDNLTRSFNLLVEGNALPVNPIAMWADPSHIWIWNATTMTSIIDEQKPCDVLFSSTPGGPCKTCASRQYTPPVTQVCMDCTVISQCAVGTRLQACNATHDAFCAPCINPPPYSFVYTSECYTAMVPPCQAGWYGTSSCTACPPFSTTPSVGAPTVAECTCQYNGSMNTTTQTCTTPSPFSQGITPVYTISELPEWLAPLGCSNTSGSSCGQCTGSMDSIDINCLPCGANGLYLQSVSPRVCLSCPAGHVGLNGLWCQGCMNLQIPNAQGTACLCHPLAVTTPDGQSCECPDGHEEIQGACVPCQPGFFSVGNASCTVCPPGTDSPVASSVCKPCPPGRFKDGNVTMTCVICPGTSAYAMDSTSGGSCRQCNTTCPAGTAATQCPTSGLACMPCDTTLDPASQYWINGAGYPDCLWGCNPGFYLQDNTCETCSVPTTCLPGFTLQPCTQYQNAGCHTPCVNDTMPMDYAVWGDRCTWECIQGYQPVRKSFQGWVEYACEWVDDSYWKNWMFY
jgi:hypothetical protein